MPAIRTTRRLLSAYAENEPWKTEYNRSQGCFDVEEKLAWGVPIFKGLLDLEARAQAQGLRKSSPEVDQLLELMPLFYQLWSEVSETYLKQAREFVEQGHSVEGLDEFQETVEEARCLLENLKLEENMHPIEKLIEQAKPNNPDPDRYED